MVPTLSGRIQTRIFVLAIVGGLVQLIVSPLLPGLGGLTTSAIYKTTFWVLFATIVLGVGWELIYHALMQFRWEKDWPTLFGLVTILNEGLLLFVLIKSGAVPGVSRHLSFDTFAADFIPVWIVVWLWVNGPMRVVSIHWRFRGGRVL